MVLGRSRFGVSTHSRLKAAGEQRRTSDYYITGFNTQPPKGGWASSFFDSFSRWVSTHSRLKAAGIQKRDVESTKTNVSTHSRLKAAGTISG